MIITKICEGCKEEFSPSINGVTPESPKCRDCLVEDLEKFPILPPKVWRRTAQAVDKIFPDETLGEPVKKFEDTFSAETVIMKHSFQIKNKSSK